MSDDRKTRWLDMLAKIDADIEKLQSALTILNQVWIEKPTTEDGLHKAIGNIGAEIALLQRKRAECEHFMNLPTEPMKSFAPIDY